MAFAARLGPLTEELVESLFTASGKRLDARSIKTARDTALQKLKSHTSLRTNQFEVENALNGLEERLRINCRDSLAEALRQGLDGLLALPSKWHPDILHLLLELSDQPVSKTRLSDLESLRPEVLETEAPLRWEDIAKEDGWGEDSELWSTIRYSDDSDDDAHLEATSSGSDLTSETPDEEASRTNIEALISQPQDVPLLDLVRGEQAWRTTAPANVHSGPLHKNAVTEIHVIREVLFMLQGLQTTMFDQDSNALPKFQTSHLTWDAHKALISSFSESGRQINLLRRFAGQEQTAAHMQAFQDCLHQHLQTFDLQASRIEARLAQVERQVVISLIAVRGELDPWLEPLAALTKVVTSLEKDVQPGPFRYLELLFDEANMAQLAGQSTTFQFLARTFLGCFDVFLRPIRYWMDEGRLIPGDTIFFVSETTDNVPLSQIWQNRYFLRKDINGGLHAPHFLRPSANKVFIAGKNIVVLRQLGKHEALRDQHRNGEPSLAYETVCPTGSDLSLFPDLFEAAFERWIQSKYRKTSQILKDTLFKSCQLSSALYTLQCLYLMSDGSAATYFCDHLFDSIDSPERAWHDRYALTVLGQEAFADSFDTSRLSIHAHGNGLEQLTSTARTSVKTALPCIEVTYRLSWPVQTVLRPESLRHYQTMFTLLLQIRKALHVLRRIRLLDRNETGYEDRRYMSLFYGLRNSLLWFCSSIQTYLTSLVLAPNMDTMRRDLEEAEDVDAMISIHDITMKLVIDEGLLGNRLTPIRECLLDVLDLSIKLEQAHRTAEVRESRQDGPVEQSDESPEGRNLGQHTSTAQSSIALKGIKSDFDRHLRFICEGLRSVARASSNSPSTKWDLLADMLHSGIREYEW